MQITDKGQVTIPVAIRRKLGLLPRTEVSFEVDGDALRIRKAEGAPGRRSNRILEHLRGSATISMSTDEIMALTRDDT